MKRRDIAIATTIIIVIWELLAILLKLTVLPAPGVVLLTFARGMIGSLGYHFLVSFGRVLASIAISVVLATPLGLALGQSKRLNRLFSPFIYLLYPIPKIVFLPIIILFLGVGNFSKVFIISLILFFQILVVVRDAASNLRPELIASVRSLGGGRRALLRFVYLPACLPAALTALRVSIGTAVAVLFFAESFATTSGLGYYIIVETWGRLAYTEMYAGVVAMSLLGLLLYLIVDALERRFCPWLNQQEQPTL